MSDTLHIAKPGDSKEFSFARAISLLGVTPEAAATFLFDNRGDLPRSWKLWQDNWLAPHLAPNFIEAYECGSKFRINEVQAVDSLLDVNLSEQLRERSIVAGKPFFDGKDEMKGNKSWAKYADRVKKAQSPGHVSVIFALQSALYNLPLASALSAYIWFEFQSGLPKGVSHESLSELSTVFEEALIHVSTAVRENGVQTGGSGNLRVV